MKEETKPRFLRVLLAWIRYLARIRPTYRWPALPDPGAFRGLPPAWAAQVFDEEETRGVLARAKTLGVTVNTLLLERVTRAVRRGLAGAPREVAWMLPINMRGGIKLQDETANHSSFLEVAVGEGEPLAALQRRVRAAIARHEHWSFWYSFQLGRFFGRAGRKLFMRLSIRGRSHWVGSFSNLGVWTPHDASPPYAWLFAPPPVPSQPIGVGCLTCHGRLAMVLQIHPSLTTDASVARAWLDDAVREIEAN